MIRANINFAAVREMVAVCGIWFLRSMPLSPEVCPGPGNQDAGFRAVGRNLGKIRWQNRRPAHMPTSQALKRIRREPASGHQDVEHLVEVVHEDVVARILHVEQCSTRDRCELRRTLREQQFSSTCTYINRRRGAILVGFLE